MLPRRSLIRAALVLALSLLAAPAAAQLGQSCTPGSAGSWAPDLNGNNWYCNGNTNTITTPAYQFSSTSTGCSSATAGTVQWTGTAVSPNNTMEYCNGSIWTTFGSSVALSALLSATTSNSIDNAGWAQTWTWNSLGTGRALTLSTTSMTTGTLLSLQDTAISNTSTGIVLSISDTTTGPGYGISSVMSGLANTGYAGYFSNTSSTGAGYGLYVTTSTTGAGYAVYGTLPLPANTGYAGYFTNSGTGAAYGVYGTMTGSASTGYAGYFTNTATSGVSYGIYGSDASASGYGGYFKNTSTGYAIYGSGNAYVNGNITDANVTSCNVLGTNSSGQLICEGGQAWNLISSQTASGSASLQFTGLGSSYFSYKLICTDVLTSTGTTLYLQFGESTGPTWKTTNYTWANDYFFPADSNVVNSDVSGSTDIGIALSNPSSTAITPGAGQIDLTISNPASTAYNKNAIGLYYAPQGGTATNSYGGAIVGTYGGDTNAITAIRIIPQSGTLSTGTCTLYGLSTSGGSNAVGGGGSVPLSGLTSALTSVSFDNSSYGQTWTWNSLTSGSAMTFGSSSLTSGNVLNLQVTASGNTGSALYALNNSTSGWGIYSAGSSPNYFAGKVGIGTTSPNEALELYTTTTGGLDFEMNDAASGGAIWTMIVADNGNSAQTGTLNFVYNGNASSQGALAMTQTDSIGISNNGYASIPTYPLDVMGNSDTRIDVGSSDTSSGNYTGYQISNNESGAMAGGMFIPDNNKTVVELWSSTDVLNLTSTGSVGIGTATPRTALDLGTNGVVVAGNSVYLTSATTDSTATTQESTGLALPAIPGSTVVRGHCTLIWEKSAGPGTTTFAIVTSAAPTGLWVVTNTLLSTATASAPTYTTITTAATTNVTPALTASTTGTAQMTYMDFVLSTAASTPVTLTIDGNTSVGADHLLTEPGSSCGWEP